MNNHSVISALLSAKFEFLGVIDLEDLDYFELIEDSWYLGVICCENLLIAINNSEVWGLSCIGEADIEARWNTTKKQIRTALKQLPIAA
ncbi:MAG: hypothetical protein ACKPB7_11195 [Sphaerospermopsis kisseleviana]